VIVNGLRLQLKLKILGNDSANQLRTVINGTYDQNTIRNSRIEIHLDSERVILAEHLGPAVIVAGDTF